jgi:hypothetical protein
VAVAVVRFNLQPRRVPVGLVVAVMAAEGLPEHKVQSILAAAAVVVEEPLLLQLQIMQVEQAAQVS